MSYCAGGAAVRLGCAGSGLRRSGECESGLHVGEVEKFNTLLPAAVAVVWEGLHVRRSKTAKSQLEGAWVRGQCYVWGD